MLDTANRFAYNEDHEMFRDTVRKVYAEHSRGRASHRIKRVR